MSSNGLSDLLQRAEQLTADMDTGSELPRIDRNLQQLAEASSRLWSRTAMNGGENTDVKASLLLSLKGAELPRLSQKLESLNAVKSFEPLEPVADTDIQGFLRNERENAVIAAIEECKRTTFSAAETHFRQSMEDEWEREKQKILNSLLSVSKDAMFFPVEAKYMDDHAVGVGRSPMTSTEMAFARQIYKFNEGTIHGRKPRIMNVLEPVIDKMEDKSAKGTWELLRHMILDLPTLDKNAAKARATENVQAAFVRNAKSFLEEKYLKFIENSVYSNLQQARLGGIPGTLNLVKSFLKISLPSVMQGLEDGSVDGIPIWPVVYFCMRCGDANATMQAAEGLPPQYSEFKSHLKEFLHSPENRIQPSSEAKVRLQYRRSVRTSTDPFKRIVYCVVGCCDSTDTHAEVAAKIDDYIWLKLHQISIDDNLDGSGERISLFSLQSLLYEEYGEGHFKAYQQPYLYCQVLFLTAQFEAGIEFLFRLDHHRCHALHFAIVLKEANLLCMPNAFYAQLLSADPSDPPPLRRLNYPRLIMNYTHKFEMTDPRESLEYFYLLRGISGPNGEDLFSSCVSELVLEAREFEMLLGKLNPDGTRKPGCIEKFKLNTSNIISTVAKDAEAKGQFEDAVLLFDLAENHDKVLEILNRLLSQVAALPSIQHSSRDRLQTTAREIGERFKRRGHQAGMTKANTFYLVLDLMYFFDLYHSNQYHAALDVMRKIKLLPFTSESVEQKVAAFKQYSDEIRQCLPDAVLTTMNILYTFYQQAKADFKSLRSSLAKGTQLDKDAYLLNLRKEAHSVVTFTGLLPYRMPGDTNARLIQLEVLMN